MIDNTTNIQEEFTKWQKQLIECQNLINQLHTKKKSQITQEFISSVNGTMNKLYSIERKMKNLINNEIPLNQRNKYKIQLQRFAYLIIIIKLN
jgi:hypothetical protein